MVVFPNAKINLGLRVLRRRPDGYHDLESLFFPIGLCDVLEILPSTELQISILGMAVPGMERDNLVRKAYDWLKERRPQLSPLDIYLLKRIPIGAGLGGGSSDAASMLQAVNRHLQLGLADRELEEGALHLGSDCPFFLINRPCLGRGRGEELTPVPLNLAGHSLVMVHPGIGISTAWAFSQIEPKASSLPWEKVLTSPPSEWKNFLENDFETPVFAKHAVLQNIKSELYQSGALYAQMSGSGSTLFGIFEKGDKPALAALVERYRQTMAVDILGL